MPDLNGFACIFDFDGVLVDSLELHYRATRDACAEHGVSVDRDEFFSLVGRPGADQIAHFAKSADVMLDPTKVYARKTELYVASLGEAECIRANCLLLASMRAMGVPVAIASSSSRRSIMPLLNKFRITCDALVTVEDVAKGKPDPEIFLKAAEKLSTPSERCIVIEDADAGVEAARRAGMAVWKYLEPPS